MVVWETGDQIVMVGRVGSWVGVVIPATVVSDDPAWLKLFVTPGTPCKRLVLASGANPPRVLSPAQIESLPLMLRDSTWSDTYLLHLTSTGQPFSVYVKWSAIDRGFRGWYVNLQTPLQRFVGGVESEDHFLDTVVAPDLTWHWKDEDELLEAIAVGRLIRDQATAIRAEGERIIAMIEAREWPFTAGIAAWRPDPAWPVPSLPDREW